MTDYLPSTSGMKYGLPSNLQTGGSGPRERPGSTLQSSHTEFRTINRASMHLEQFTVHPYKASLPTRALFNQH